MYPQSGLLYVKSIRGRRFLLLFAVLSCLRGRNGGKTGPPVSESQEDPDLIAAFLSGNQRGFDLLVLRYQDRVFNVCYRLLGDYEESLDAAQDTFVKVFRGLKKFRGDAGFSTWLYRIAVNTCKSRLSSVQFRLSKRALSLEGGRGTEDCGAPLEVENGSFLPERMLERREREEAVQHAISALPGDWKTLVVLRDIEGLSYEEIASATGKNIGTVKSKLSRARRKLREKLKDKV